MFDVVDFSFGDMPRKYLENRAHDLLRINRIIVAKSMSDVIEKIALVPFFYRLIPKCPTIVVETTNEDRQLRSQIDGLLNGEPIS